MKLFTYASGVLSKLELEYHSIIFLLAMKAKIPIASNAPIVIGRAKFVETSSSSDHVTGFVDAVPSSVT